MPDLTDTQVWQRVYERHGDFIAANVYGSTQICHDHIALRVLWPEIVEKQNGPMLTTALDANKEQCSLAFAHASERMAMADDPATAIARLWGEVCGDNSKEAKDGRAQD